ncbi:MAG TPA: hypothetical protein VGQ17_08210, partial [Gemmatimonadales bacterium]|nr:hypothetical protein [Gemmatimonadales bacterium]
MPSQRAKSRRPVPAPNQDFGQADHSGRVERIDLLQPLKPSHRRREITGGARCSPQALKRLDTPPGEPLPLLLDPGL